MDNGAHFDGDQSGTVNGVTPPRAALTPKSPQTAGISGLAAGNAEGGEGRELCFA
ncbi:hypothetical protein ECP03052934_4995 [Escherichia coli p0305293.4]|nr:hypothetical protein ECP03052934_4995 [Escherichia coli p0305293.4]